MPDPPSGVAVRRRLLVPLLAVVALVAAPLAPAAALEDSWAAWDPISGSSNNYTTTMRQDSPGFPAATVRTDSRGNVQLAGGTSTSIGPGTPPGGKYGTSSGNPYLVLRPRADNAGAPSTTTYTFDSPTPDIGWAFVLGDVDADQVRISARDAAGNPVPDATIDGWFQGAFNHAGGADLPSWDGGSATLVGNPRALDTDGASGWFEPDVALTGLTLTFTRRAGFPVYQTWFVSRARPVTGSVADAGEGAACDVTEATLTLLTPAGEALGTTTPDADGDYTFGDVATQAGYLVRLTVPEGCAAADSPVEQTVDNRGEESSEDSQADFAVRAIVPQPISGFVRDGAEEPVPGVTVTLTGPDGSTATTTTDENGAYLFDDNEEVPEVYTIGIDVPAGYVPGPDGVEIDDVLVEDEPITEQDFVLLALATVSGTVTGGGGGVGGVRVVVTPEGGGAPFVAVTRGDGSYDIAGVPPGDHTIALEGVPEGYSGGGQRPLGVGSEDVEGADFALSRPGGLGGEVVDADDAPLAGVQVVLTGPGGQVQTLITDAAGRYVVDGLAAGDYDVTIQPPDGLEVEGGDDALTATLTEAGEVVGDLDFVLVAVEEPTPTPSPSASPTPEPSPTSSRPSPSASPSASATSQPPPTGPPAPPPGGTGAGGLPSTGADLGVLPWSFALLALGAAAVLWSRRRTAL